MITKINWNLPIETVTGEPAKYVTNVNNTERPFIIAFGQTEKNPHQENVHQVDAFGANGNGIFLVRNKIRKPREYFVNVYYNSKYRPTIHDTENEALIFANDNHMLIAEFFKVKEV